MNKSSISSKQRIIALIEKKEKQIVEIESEIERLRKFSKEHNIPFNSDNSEAEIRKIKSDLISLYERASRSGIIKISALSTS